jgi:FkbM family methyltransferase
MAAVRELAVAAVNRVPGRLAASFRSGGVLARAAAPLLERALPTGLTEVVVRSGPARGLRLLIDPQREKYYWTGTYERPVQDAFEAMLRPGDVVWDVGGHIGFFSLLASRLVGEEGLVVAFEPVEENRARLEENLRLNRTENVVVRPEAIAAECGPAVLHGRGSSSMWTMRETADDAPGVVVRCLTLDAVLAETHPPTLVKIDVEDLELDVLRGAVRVLAEHRPSLVVELPTPSSDDWPPAESYVPHRLGDRHWLLKPDPA